MAYDDAASDRILDDDTGLGLHHGDALSPGAADAVANAARWGKYYLYLALGYLVLSFGVQLFTLGSLGAATEELGGAANPFGAGFIVGQLVFTLVFVLLLYAYPVFKFWRFTHDTPGALAEQSQARFTGAIDSLRSVYKYIGVALLIFIGIYALMIVAVILFGGLAALAG